MPSCIVINTRPYNTKIRKNEEWILSKLWQSHYWREAHRTVIRRFVSSFLFMDFPRERKATFRFLTCLTNTSQQIQMNLSQSIRWLLGWTYTFPVLLRPPVTYVPHHSQTPSDAEVLLAWGTTEDCVCACVYVYCTHTRTHAHTWGFRRSPRDPTTGLLHIKTLTLNTWFYLTAVPPNWTWFI